MEKMLFSLWESGMTFADLKETNKVAISNFDLENTEKYFT